MLIVPGAIDMTRMPSGERSRAATRVIPTTPPLAAEYGSWPIWPSNAAIEAVLMMTPRAPFSSGSWRAMAAAACRMTLNTAVR